MDLRLAHAVTMLFSDIEGSTQLARRLGPADWSAVLAKHHSLLEQAVASAGGEVVQTEGDGALAFFPTASAGVDAAGQAQLAFATADWGANVTALRVRMGLHTGVVEPHPQGWVGLDLHLAARIAASANGGQILISSATRRELDDTIEVRDLGEHRLKDFPEPEHLHHVLLHGEEPPAPRTQAVRPTNLSPQIRPLVGRAGERKRLTDLLRSGTSSVVTLTGPGGIGKTRLALQVAAEVLDDFPGGVFVVRLAGVRAPADLLAAVAEALGMSGEKPATLMDQLADRLAVRPTLLVLDNFEQLLEAAPLVATLAERAPDLRILVTSQIPLHLSREHLMRLGPLEGDGAVELFMERARARLGEFSAGPEEERAIAEICDRLEGMPLAIELAAARLALLGPVELAERLHQPLALLTRGDRDLPERHQSLRATIAWTCDLLDDAPRRLLTRMVVCAGPVPLSMLEALSSPERSPEQVLDDLDALLDCSLVRRIGDRRLGSRFLVPQALRDYALMEMIDGEEEAIIRRRHAERLAEVAHAAQLWKWGTTETQRSALLALALEVRPALAWAAEHDRALHVRLAARLAPYLVYRGVLSETRDELRRARIAGVGETAERAWVTTLLAKCEQLLGDSRGADLLTDEALALWNQLGDEPERGAGLGDLSWVLRWSSRFDAALDLMHESLRILRASGDQRLLLRGLVFKAHALADMHDVAGTLAVLDEAGPLAGDDPLWELDAIRGDCAVDAGEPARAVAFYAKSLAWTSESGEAHQALMDMRSLAICLAGAGQPEAALEMDALTGLIERETGRLGVPAELDELRQQMRRDATRQVGAQASQAAVERAQNVAPGQRVLRALELCGVSQR